MTVDLTQILVFKTNISTESEKARAGQVLSGHPQIAEWSIDTEDVDRVLRIVSPYLGASDIIHLISHAGFDCRELE